MLAKSDTFLLGYDSEHGTDISCLAIMKVIDGKLTVTKMLYGEEADNVYKKLEEGPYGL